MNRTITIAIIALIAAPSASPAPASDKPGASSAGDNAAVREVKQLEEELREASLKGNVAFFEAHWDDNYVRTNSFGVLLTKPEALKNYKTGNLKYSRLEFGEDRVFPHGDTVVVSARVTVKGQYESMPLDGVFRHTRVWKKQPDGWKVIAYHASRITHDDPDE